MLGNCDLNQIIKEEYIQKVQDFLDNNDYRKTDNCDDVKKENGNYHIYDIPRVIVVCGEHKMNELIEFMRNEGIIGDGLIGEIGFTYCDKSA